MEVEGFVDNMIIVVILDYGDYMGDYWMGDKDFYYEIVVKVLLIISDLCFEVDGMCGFVIDVLVEMIDLVFIFMNVVGCLEKFYIIEGCDFMLILYGIDGFCWNYVISEYDYYWFDMVVVLD